MSSPALATSRGSSKAIRMRSGRSDGNIYQVFLPWGWFLSSNPLSQILWSAFSSLLHDDLIHPFGGSGFSQRVAPYLRPEFDGPLNEPILSLSANLLI